MGQSDKQPKTCFPMKITATKVLCSRYMVAIDIDRRCFLCLKKNALENYKGYVASSMAEIFWPKNKLMQLKITLNFANSFLST